MCNFCSDILTYDEFEKNRYESSSELAIVWDKQEHKFVLRYGCTDEYYSFDKEINYCPECGHNLTLELDEFGNYNHMDFNNEDKYKSIKINNFVFILGRGVTLIVDKVDIKDLKVGMIMYLNGKKLHLSGFEYNGFSEFYAKTIMPVGLVFGKQLNQDDVKIGDKIYYRRTKT